MIPAVGWTRPDGGKIDGPKPNTSSGTLNGRMKRETSASRCLRFSLTVDVSVRCQVEGGIQHGVRCCCIDLLPFPLPLAHPTDSPSYSQSPTSLLSSSFFCSVVVLFFFISPMLRDPLISPPPSSSHPSLSSSPSLCLLAPTPSDSVSLPLPSRRFLGHILLYRSNFGQNFRLTNRNSSSSPLERCWNGSSFHENGSRKKIKDPPSPRHGNFSSTSAGFIPLSSTDSFRVNLNIPRMQPVKKGALLTLSKEILKGLENGLPRIKMSVQLFGLPHVAGTRTRITLICKINSRFIINITSTSKDVPTK